VVAVFVLLRPLADGSVSEIISTICRGVVLDTQKNFAFGPNQRWKTRLKLSLSRVSTPYVLARLGWGLGWICLLLFIALRAAGVDLTDVFSSGSYWRQVALVFAALAVFSVVTYLGRPVVRVLFWHFKDLRRRTRLMVSRW